MSRWRTVYDERRGSIPVTDLYKARCEEAQERYERERALLFRSDGTKKHSGPEHAEREAALQRERDTVLREVEAQAKEDQAKMEREVRALEGGDPTMLLSATELEQANRKREFVSDDVDALSVPVLKERLAAVLAGGDRASMFCYMTAAERRCRELTSVDPALNKTVDKLRDALMGEQRRKDVENRRQEIRDLEKVKSLAWSLQRGARTPGGVYRRRAYGPVRERFEART